ncbi:hypothetical protein SDC9_189782 [bioreactor metagenome]|uniref:Uncharacterized protein n=1 Tax=bioreactor metagenome TaxID=1076179 RepID=A0A645HUG7_9ZZZZ
MTFGHAQKLAETFVFGGDCGVFPIFLLQLSNLLLKPGIFGSQLVVPVHISVKLLKRRHERRHHALAGDRGGVYP